MRENLDYVNDLWDITIKNVTKERKKLLGKKDQLFLIGILKFPEIKYFHVYIGHLCDLFLNLLVWVFCDFFSP